MMRFDLTLSPLRGGGEVSMSLFLFYLCIFPIFTYYATYTMLYIAAFYDTAVADAAEPPAPAQRKRPRDFAPILRDILDGGAGAGVDWNANVVAAAAADWNANVVVAAAEVGADMESLWKTRTLIKYTEPYGNIIMHYDFYRKGFVYYCDLHSVKYEILQSMACEYVIQFRCISFWEAAAEDVVVAAPAATATGGSYKISTLNQRITTRATAAAVTTEPAVHYHKFIRVGRVSDYSFLKKPATSVERRGGGVHKKISYTDFRKRRGGGGAETMG